MNYNEISKETFDLLYKSRASLGSSPLSAGIRALVELRVSQINECAYCYRLHSAEARKVGVEQDKLDLLAVWKNAIIFTEEEKAALEWAELVTCLEKDLHEAKKKLLGIYSEKQFIDLTACIALMNALNRIAISLRD